MKFKPFVEVVGSLMYVVLCSRPNLVYAISVISKLQYKPGLPHWIAVMRVIRYIQGKLDLSLTYQGDELEVEGYCDANYVGDPDDRKWTAGFIFLFNGVAVNKAHRGS